MLAAELTVSAFARSLRFYTDVLGFTTMHYDAAGRVAELEREGTVLLVAEHPVAGNEAEGELAYPYGRGVVLRVWVADIEAVYTGIQAYGARLHKPLAEYWREEEGSRAGHYAFDVMDPDGYRLRFCQPIIARGG